MSASSLTILCRYHYDPLDRLTGVSLLERASTQRFYQQDHLTTELGEQTQRTIFRYEARPLAQQQSTAGVTVTTLLATDQAHSTLQTLAQPNPQQLAYTAYGHHPAKSGLSRLLGFNGECPDAITGHYLLGQGTRAFNPVLMRFNSPDNLSPFGAGGINSYAYCGGDPINFYDPTGHTLIGLISFRLWNKGPGLDLTMHAPVEAARRSVIVEAARTSVIAKNPMHRIQPSSHSIARPGRSTSTSTPIANTPIANAQQRSTSILPPEGARRDNSYGPSKKPQNRHNTNTQLNEDARLYDDHMAANPHSEIRPRPDLEAKYLEAVALHSRTKDNFSQLAYTRRRAKQNVVSQLIDNGLLIRNK